MAQEPNEKLNTVLSYIASTPGMDSEIAKTLLEFAVNSAALNALQSMGGTNVKKPAVKTPKIGEGESDYLQFTKGELRSMPKDIGQYFAANDKIVRYRVIRGMYQARFHAKGYHIEVASKDFNVMKQKFLTALNGNEQGEKSRRVKRTAHNTLFSTYVDDWLTIKKNTTKPSTFRDYSQVCNTYLKPTFGDMKIEEFSRDILQEYLFSFTNKGINRTAAKLRVVLYSIFEMAQEDFEIKNPVKKIVLPYYEPKKGSAFTKEEEKRLVEYCIEKKDSAASSALLVLMYFGLRYSELKSIEIIDGNYLKCETAKERFGRDPVYRCIPFTPVFKKVLPYVDFEKAKNTKHAAIKSALRRLYGDHHPHELRYTFITRAKECGVAPEVVMLWDGHKQDKDVRTSKVDRGYTDYSNEYFLKQAELISYEL